MKTFTTPLQQSRQVQLTVVEQVIPAMAGSVREILALTSAAILAAAIVTLSTLVAGMEMTDIIGAGIWGVGFIFFGLAIDNIGPKGLLHVLTGIALLVLAWLQSVVSADYVIISGILVATWAAVSLFKRLR